MYYWNGFALGLLVSSALFFVYAYVVVLPLKHPDFVWLAGALIVLEAILFIAGAGLMLYTSSRWK